MNRCLPALTLKTEHSVGLSGFSMCIGIQNGGLELELQKIQYITLWERIPLTKKKANEQFAEIIK